MSKFSLKSKEYKLSEENALIQLNEILEFFNFDVDKTTNIEAKSQIEQTLEMILDDIRLGNIEVNSENGLKIIQHQIGGGTDIIYKDFSGKMRLATASKKKDDINGQIMALLGSASGLGETVFTQLSPKNYKVAERLGLLFL